MEDSILSKVIEKEIKVQCSKPKNRLSGQYFIQIPKEVIRELNIKKGDKVVMKVPLTNKKKYSIKFKRLKL